MRRLSALADACVGAAINFLLRDAHAARQAGAARSLDTPARTPAGSCSAWASSARASSISRPTSTSSCSSIPTAPAIKDPADGTELFSRLARRLVRILQDRTGDGYVFRTDLQAAARSRLDAARHPRRRGADLLRGQGPELGARRHDQGAPGRRRPRGRRSLPRRAAALCLAQIHGLRGDRRRPFDQAPDPCAQGSWRDRGEGPQRQARPRRHPRDRVLRADPAADRRRPFCRPARPRDGADAERARRARLDHCRDRATR